MSAGEVAKRILEHEHASALMGGDAATRAKAASEIHALARAYLEAREALREIAEPSMKPWPRLADERRGMAAAFLAEHEEQR